LEKQTKSFITLDVLYRSGGEFVGPIYVTYRQENNTATCVDVERGRAVCNSVIG